MSTTSRSPEPPVAEAPSAERPQCPMPATPDRGSQGSDAPRGGSGAMFDTIAARYDLLNRMTSFGLDRRWRKRMVASLGLVPGSRVLDLATGTADVALAILADEPAGHVVGVDPSTHMLAVGRDKVRAARLAHAIDLREGDACALPFERDSFDAVTIAFGIRNVPDRPRALAEMARVVRPGGRIAVLELTEPRGGLIGRAARLHVHRIVPALGSWLSRGRGDAYRYLEKSIAAFPPPEDFAAMMTASGLEVLQVCPLSFGAVHLFVAQPDPAREAHVRSLGAQQPLAATTRCEVMA